MPVGASTCAAIAKANMIAAGQGVFGNPAEMALAWSKVWRPIFDNVLIPPPNPALPVPIDRTSLFSDFEASIPGLMVDMTFASGPLIIQTIVDAFAKAVVVTTPPALGVALPPLIPFVPAGSTAGPDAASQAFALSLLAWVLSAEYTPVATGVPVPWQVL